jgi:hypothetical protein
VEKWIAKTADYAAAVLMGTGTVFLVSSLLGGEWNLFAGMAAGMVLGLLTMAVVFVLFMRVSTAFHLFPVGMPVTMITGMVAGMAVSEGVSSPGILYSAAAGYSILVSLAVDRLDARLRGDVPVED